MYGIPTMKLSKEVVQRRVDLMAAEGVTFKVIHLSKLCWRAFLTFGSPSSGFLLSKVIKKMFYAVVLDNLIKKILMK